MAIPVSRIAHPSEAPSLRWGILAPGGISTTFAHTVQKNTRQSVVAVGSRSAERAQRFAEQFEIPNHHGSYEALVADSEVDAVYVGSVVSGHAEHALLAIEAGKHVLVEKSFTSNAAEAQQVASAARDANVTLMEAMWSWFLPHYDVLRQLVADGAFGDIEVVTADHGQRVAYDPTGRMYDPALGGGAMLDLGVYPVSFAHFVLGAPGRVQAAGTATDTGVDATVSAVFDQHSTHPGAQALVNTSLLAKTPTTATVNGTRGPVEIPGSFYMPQQVRWIPQDGEPDSSPVPEILGHEGLAYEAAHFAQLVAEGRLESDLMPLSDTIAIMATMDETLGLALG